MSTLQKLAKDYLGGAMSTASFRLQLISELARATDADLIELAMLLEEEGMHR